MKRLKIWWFAALLLVVLFGVTVQSSKATASASRQIYWGAYIDGGPYGLGDAPWNTTTLDTFEAHAKKKISIIHWGQSWWNCKTECGYQYFSDQQSQYERMRKRGIIPLVDWASQNLSAPDPGYEQPKFALRTIIRGDHDAYIRKWAQQAKAWGHPFFLRFNWEMNGTWYAWSEKRNGNQPGEFAQAWRRVHRIFEEVGANNVTWVWCVNTIYDGSVPLQGLYPGDAFVDWTCMDGYNRGENPLKNDRWRNFKDLFTPTYNALLEIAPSKPIMIGETASTEIGGSKAAWIRNALTDHLPNSFPKVQAILWFNWNAAGMDWVIETSPEAQNAFAQGISSDYYAGSDFASLSISPIPPIEKGTTPFPVFKNKVFLPLIR